jgi:hypothetical protein
MTASQFVLSTDYRQRNWLAGQFCTGFKVIPDRVISLNKTGQAQAPNPGGEINFETLRARALESSIVGKNDVSAIVTNLPPVGENLHRPESGAGGAIRAASFFRFPGRQGWTLHADGVYETSTRFKWLGGGPVQTSSVECRPPLGTRGRASETASPSGATRSVLRPIGLCYVVEIKPVCSTLNTFEK